MSGPLDDLQKKQAAWYERALPMAGRATFLPFRDSLPGSVMNKREFALPGILAGIANAISAPGRAFTGSDPSFYPEAEAVNLGMNMMGAGIGTSMAKPVPAGSLGMFTGRSSKTWNPQTVKIAQEMEAAGIDSRKIWEITGNWKGPDGQWRQEIPDNLAKFRENFDSFAPSRHNNYNPVDLPIGGAVSHTKLFQAYPDLLATERANIAKRPDWMPENNNSGSYTPGTLSIRDKTEGGALSTLLHELQHSVQKREDFARGGMPSLMAKEAEKKNLSNFEAYRRLMGEAEARATESRAMLNELQRRQLFPEDSYDVPINSLIYKK